MHNFLVVNVLKYQNVKNEPARNRLPKILLKSSFQQKKMKPAGFFFFCSQRTRCSATWWKMTSGRSLFPCMQNKDLKTVPVSGDGSCQICPTLTHKEFHSRTSTRCSCSPTSLDPHTVLKMSSWCISDSGSLGHLCQRYSVQIKHICLCLFFSSLGQGGRGSVLICLKQNVWDVGDQNQSVCFFFCVRGEGDFFLLFNTLFAGCPNQNVLFCSCKFSVLVIC